MWHAQPSNLGGYSLSSIEARDNVNAIYDVLYNLHLATLESASAFCAVAYWLSELNPWYYNHYGSPTTDYGLMLMPFDSYRYLSFLPNYSPNLSDSSVTSGATADDGEAQVTAIADSYIAMWDSSCWKSDWRRTQYPQYWQLSRKIIIQYGSNYNSLGIDQFFTINDIQDACFAMLACYEYDFISPTLLNSLVQDASTIYTIINGQPPTPPTPIPTKKKTPFWVYLRRH